MYSRRTWQQNNRDKINAYNKAWREANPEKFRESQMKWRRNNEGHTFMQGDYLVYVGFEHPACWSNGITPVHRIVLWNKLAGQDARCNWCDKYLIWNHSDWEIKMVADHIDGDTLNNDPSNLVPSCNRCNLTRHHKSDSKLPCTFEGCDRPQDSNALCSSHYNQQWRGIELKPIRNHTYAVVTDTHRQCTGCKEFKTFDKFYTSNGKSKARCKQCTIIQTNAANKRRRLEGR